MSRFLRLFTLASPFLGALLASGLPVHAQEAAGERRRLNFSGLAEAGVASDYGTFNRLAHRTALEVDLTTHVAFHPAFAAQVRTTLRDGHAPRQGAGATWTELRYDGAQINWKPGRKTILMAGDLIGGSGYFQYTRYRRVAAVVGEHSLRGAGVRHGNLVVHTGLATDTAGVAEDWAVYVRWTRTITEHLSWSPSFRYTAGLHKAYPFELGVSFNGNFEDMFLLQGHMAMNYWNTATDPGSLILIEPRYVYGDYFVAATLLYSDKGEVPAPNTQRLTHTWVSLEDLLLSVEPGKAFGGMYAASLSLEYRDPRFTHTRDQSVGMIPTLWIYPAPRAEWRLWTSLEKPLASGRAGHPRFGLGSELSFVF
ncbi:MAG TPA: hypothetical protein VKZ88_06775 [Fibrobacteria bacterium]|jgi:hypothetical protein|nr:hypothetical protein [Fibrobacteria bacterium]